MIKQISTIVLLTAALLISGVFHSSAEASASIEDSKSNHGKIQWHDQTVTDWSQQLKTYFNKWYKIKWNYNNKGFKEEKKEEPKQEEQAPTENEQPKPETPVEQEPVPVPSERPESNPAKEETEQTQPQIEQLNEFERQVVELTNNERVNQGLAPFQVDLELSRVAREKSRDMLGSNYFDHNSPTYGSPFDMMRAYGINYRTAGENIAKGQRTPSEVVNAWMNSPGHRANILNSNFTHIGVGYVEQGNHWTQQFIGK